MGSWHHIAKDEMRIDQSGIPIRLLEILRGYYHICEMSGGPRAPSLGRPHVLRHSDSSPDAGGDTVPRDDDKPTPEQRDRAEGRDMPPWWSESAPEDAQLPEGFPERPDLAKVKALRDKLRADKAAGGDHHRTPIHDRVGRRQGKAAKDIGSYTLIPMMMIVGPVMGWLVGHWLEGRIGGAPWLGVVGILFGMAAAVRQIILMLQRRTSDKEKKADKERKKP